MQSRHKGFYIRAVVSNNQAATLDYFFKQLSRLQARLELIVPRSLKPKFSSTVDGLVVLVEIERASDAGRMTHEMEEYIKAAIISY
ncbi:MAG: hypothetical protein SFW63_08050 [Alphaproteobacteria bacterium]|nr:hypothetical protein [Alphaproteobacteria bacterium]